MTQGAGEDRPSAAEGDAHHGVELRHLRYLVAIADAGTFTQAAERMFVTQPTLSQQMRRLGEMVRTPLLDRRRGGGPRPAGGVGDGAVPDRARGAPQSAGGGPGPPAAAVRAAPAVAGRARGGYRGP